ncbi:MAG: peptidoglycan-binding domain-containing protein [Candidatus Paceibacterota bacterium]
MKKIFHKLRYLISVTLIVVVLPLAVQAYEFSNSLDVGDRGPDVFALQSVLKGLGFFDYPNITGYFGPVTQSAVQAFQTVQNIVSFGTPESTGFGRVGPQTRAVLNGLGTLGSEETTFVPPPRNIHA